MGWGWWTRGGPRLGGCAGGGGSASQDSNKGSCYHWDGRLARHGKGVVEVVASPIRYFENLLKIAGDSRGMMVALRHSPDRCLGPAKANRSGVYTTPENSVVRQAALLACPRIIEECRAWGYSSWHIPRRFVHYGRWNGPIEIQATSHTENES